LESHPGRRFRAHTLSPAEFAAATFANSLDRSTVEAADVDIMVREEISTAVVVDTTKTRERKKDVIIHEIVLLDTKLSCYRLDLFN
jgi:hypothetical protein